MEGFKGTTYEVMTGDGSRWLIDSVHRQRTKATAKAEALLAAAGDAIAAVRIVAKKDGWSAEKVVFEQAAELREKTYRIQTVTGAEAAPCAGIADYYRPRARRTAGRVLRQYLDDEGITALQLMFDAGRLVMLDREGRLLGSAIQHVAGVQAKAAGEDARQRTEALFQAFERVRSRARDPGETEDLYAILTTRGADALMAELRETRSPEARSLDALAALAMALGDAADWDGKLRLLINLAAKAADADAVALIDGAIAEILDGAAALQELLGEPADLAHACRRLARLTVGRSEADPDKKTCLGRLNNLMASHALAEAKSVLLGRAARSLGGTAPLTHDGGDADRRALSVLLRDMIDYSGLLGGGAMSEAVTLRAKMTLGAEDDLSIQEAIDQVLALLPTQAVRLGYLLDLAQTPLGEKNQPVVLGDLAHLIDKLTSMASLMPAGTPRPLLLACVESLKRRISQGTLPDELRDAFAASLDRLINAEPPPHDAGEIPMPAKERAVEHRQITTGEIIFEEGESGTEAFIIADGTVEIYRRVGNREQVLATVGRGEVIGEMSLVDRHPRMASARALAGTELIVISENDLQRRLDRLVQTDKVLRRLIDTLVKRVRGQARISE